MKNLNKVSCEPTMVRTEIITTLKKYGMSYAELQRDVKARKYNAIVLTSVTMLRWALC